MLGLGTLFYTILLSVNAIAILNEDRFLARVGWSSSSASYDHGFGSQSPGQDPGIKARLINLISAVRVLLRLPLIAVNIIVIIWEITEFGLKARATRTSIVDA